MRRFIVLLVSLSLSLAILYPTGAQTGNIHRLEKLSVYERTVMATVRVRRDDGGTGSGVCFAENKDEVWIFSAGHVVRKAKSVSVEFYSMKRNGFFVKSLPLVGRVKWSVDESDGPDLMRDAAVIIVRKKDFGSYPLPPIVPFAKKNHIPILHQGFISTGCAHGYSPTTIIGFVSKTHEHKFSMVPGTAPGRSGSAIFSMDGSKVIGIILRRDTAVNVRKVFSVTGWNKEKK